MESWRNVSPGQIRLQGCGKLDLTRIVLYTSVCAFHILAHCFELIP